MKNIVLTGSLSFDYIFDVNDSLSNYILPDKIHKINFSFVVENHKKSWGGTAANQGFYLGKLGMNPFILATGGNDFSDFNNFLSNAGVNVKYLKQIKKIPTATGFVITDKNDNQIWVYSKGAMINNAKLRLNRIYSSDKNILVVIAPNDQKAIINFVNDCLALKIEFLFDPAFYIPTLPLKTLSDGIKNTHILFGNDYEIAFIEKRLGKKISNLLKDDQILVKTLGNKGSKILINNKKYTIGVYKVKAVDPTGAGDAYRAGFIYGYLNGYPITTCGWMGAVVASFAVEVKGTMNLKFNKKAFEKRLKSVIN